jgi:hypothetical protein
MKKDKQRELDYCMYMMVSGFFKKASCESWYWERNLFTSYIQMKEDDQCKLERRCIHVLHKLFKSLPFMVTQDKAVIHLNRTRLTDTEYDPATNIIIETDAYRMTLKSCFKKNKIKIECRYQYKKRSLLAA